MAGRVGQAQRRRDDREARARALVLTVQRPERRGHARRTRRARRSTARLGELGFARGAAGRARRGRRRSRAALVAGAAAPPPRRHDRRHGPDAARRDARRRPSTVLDYEVPGHRRGDARRRPAVDAVRRPVARPGRRPRRDADRQRAGLAEGRAGVVRGRRARCSTTRSRRSPGRSTTPPRAPAGRADLPPGDRRATALTGVRAVRATSRSTRWCSRCSGARRRSSCSRWRATCGCSRPRATRAPPTAPMARLWGTVRYGIVQTRMFRDLGGRAPARGDLLGLRPAHDRDRQHRHRRPDPGDRLDPVRRRAVGRGHRDAERRRGDRARVASRWAYLAAAGHAAEAPHASPATRSLILLLIGGVVATELLAEVFEVAAYGADRRARSSRNAAGGALARRATRRRCRRCSRVLWWAHIAARRRVPVLPAVRKHLHIATAILNIALRKLAPRGELPAMDLEAEDATFGIRTVADLSWKDLLDGFTCTECGRCQEACPAWAHRQAAQPQDVHHGHPPRGGRGGGGPAADPRTRRRCATFGLDDSLCAAAVARPLVDTAIPYDAVWDCLTCGACVEACPVTIEHVDKIVGLRRNLVLEDSRFPAGAHGRVQGHGERRQPVGPAAVGAARLGEGPAVRGPDRGRGPGRRASSTRSRSCTGSAARRRSTTATGGSPGPSSPASTPPASRSPSSARRSRAPATRRAGWATSTCSRSSPSQNVETLNRYRMGERTIVTACPHCFNTIGNEYGQLGGSFTIRHHSQYLSALVADGRLALGADGLPGRSVTYHDSCYLARYNGVIAAPRDGAGRRSRASSCARWRTAAARRSAAARAAGGCGWRRRAARGSTPRARARSSTPARDTVATACPFCMVMLRDGLNDAGRGVGSEDAVSAQDISELLAAAIAPFGGRQVPEGARSR